MMKRYAVYIEQVNQERIVVDTKDPLEARQKAIGLWRNEYLYPLIIDVMELSGEVNGS